MLTINLLSGAEVAVIKAKPCETIRAVKRQIEAVEGTHVKQQRLLHGQEILSNRQTLAQAGLQSGTAVQLLRMCAEEEPPPPAAREAVEVLDLEDLDDQPNEDEIDEFAEWLGMDPDADAHLLWIAEAGLKAPLPRHWRPCRTPDGDIFYFNFQTGKSVWDHPCDAQYRELYRMHKHKELAPSCGGASRLRKTAAARRHRGRQGGLPPGAGGAADAGAAGDAGALGDAGEAPKPRRCRSRLRELDLGGSQSAGSALGSASSEDWELPRRVLASSPHGLYGPQAWRELVRAASIDTEPVEADSGLHGDD